MPSMELYSDAFIWYCVAYDWLTLQSILNIFAGVLIVQAAFFARAIFVFAVATIAVSIESHILFNLNMCQAEVFLKLASTKIVTQFVPRSAKYPLL